MNKKSAVSIAAAAAAISAGPAVTHAAELDGPAVPPATSYADLLQPIPNAIERLRASDAEVAPTGGKLFAAEYAPPSPPGAGPFAHHHHHHHHHHARRWYL